VNLVLFESHELKNRTLELSDYRFEHIRDVHRATVGDSLRIGELNGLCGVATITSFTDESLSLDVNLDTPPPPKLPLTLILALPRPKMLRRILRSVAELGVAELILINASRVEKSFWQSPVLSSDSAYRYFRQGLEQSRDTVLPILHIAKRFKPFIEDEFPAIATGKTALLAHPGLGEHCPHGLVESTVLVVGPEGGFIPYEVDMMMAAGCRGIHLGDRILRVENAVTTLVAKLFD
jgi:16S rRNA (uracil1498-N3)-methyltransferase